MLPTRDDIGRYHAAGRKNIAGSLRPEPLPVAAPAFALAVNTCMRYSEIRLLRWKQVDFNSHSITVGKSKSDAGTGRVIPVNARAWTVLEFWAGNFPDPHPTH
jgi:integrase